MNFRTTVLSIALVAVSAAPIRVCAEESLADMYQRKGVKEFVARQYDLAINDLEQARAADPLNPKTAKLLAKCWERKGASLFDSGDIEAASRCFAMALEVDPANEDARKALSRVDASRASSAAVRSAAPVQQVQQVYTPPPPSVPQSPLIITSQISGGDSMQSRVVAGLLNNFQQQQQLMAQQLTASNELMKKTDTQKDAYLAALIRSSDQKTNMMSQFILVGAVVVVVVILVALLIFVFIFSKFAKASELRTIQATEALQAVLANQPLAIAQQNQSQLLLSGPAGSSTADPASAPGAAHPEAAKAQEALIGVSLEELSSLDPSQRAKAVELFESELADGGAANPALATKVEKLKELLDDTNNRVRANAAKAYYYVDAAISLKIFGDMLSGDSSRLRASALWALGEIGTAETLTLILEKDSESDEIVRYNIRMALEKIRSRNRFPLTEEVRVRLEGLIERYADAV